METLEILKITVMCATSFLGCGVEFDDALSFRLFPSEDPRDANGRHGASRRSAEAVQRP